MKSALAVFLTAVCSLGILVPDGEASGQNGKGDRIVSKIASSGTQPSQFDPENSALYRPRNPSAKFNAGFAWLCVNPTDVAKFRNLMAAGGQQIAANMRDCVTVERPVEVIQIDQIGDNLIEVSYPLNGQAVDLWTESTLFQSRNDWLVDQCVRTGNSWSDCFDSVYH